MSACPDPGALIAQLQSIVGEEAFVRLCQELGGTRVYIPLKCRDGGELMEAIGRDACDRLSRALAPATIRVPLARRERALHYLKQGLSIPRIARRLGLTETGVSKLIKRESAAGTLPERKADPRQMSLL